MFGLIQQEFIAVLRFKGSSASIVKAPDHIKCVSLNNQKCWSTQTTLINVHPTKCIEGLCYCSFAVNLERCMRSYNTLNDLSTEYAFQTKQKI